jgi:hypothetical protein
MRKTLAIALVLGLSAGGALAQTPAPATGPQNSAVNTGNSSNRMAAGPVKGANSFTESEARSRIEKNGFTNVSGLKKDDDGIWRGMGMKNGQQVAVALDYQGNVFFGDAARAMNGQTMPGHNGNAASGSSAR